MNKVRHGQVRAAAGVLAATLVATVLVSGCQDDDSSGDATSAASSATPEPQVPTRVELGTVTGKLPHAARQKLSRQVRAVVDGWFDAAYLDGDYPRSGRRAWADAWPGFTAGAGAEAAHDAALMSNRDLGARIDGVTAKRKSVRIDALAVKGRPAGATAHVRLRYVTSGDAEKRVMVAGRLYLTPTPKGWRVFGYDMTKDGA